MSTSTPPDGDPPARPDFGPSGYLPARAAQRARKIVLRAPLGLQWIVAALVAGLVVVVAGVLFLGRTAAPPSAPWVEIGELAAIADSEPAEDLDALLVTVGGRPRAFAGADGVAYCAASGRLEAPDGGVWSLTGRGLGGTPSLAEHPTLVQDGLLYVDPSRTAAGVTPATDPVELGCS